jgi:hypothetical protein
MFLMFFIWSVHVKTVKTRQSLVDLVEISRDKSRGMDEEFLEALFAQLGGHI